ncbi:ABC multidrug transporter, putative [Talaromyces stipitatus ATCC 10500]|uniref:ABC multidrug transporter, putative n=1 Tax=Talaromyces stipitatus (strain ATCC 10500 / CBS 375.48 / QM 6759 / NRRL 1006) TaxID=441959 RepID=B8M542_TALSN|nr:ABC multidrug transporter, putative [Talaromyces stipitatus ATCC 10500]EED19648.1 ABC multidrug transporter, putative [Talaromyces stipitatus ATCC 10500]
MNHFPADQSILEIQKQRDVWRSRTENVAFFIARGDLHLGILVISASAFLLKYLLYLARRLWAKSEDDGEKSPAFVRFYTPPAYNIAQIAFATASFALSVAALPHDASWKRSLLLGYATALYAGRFAGRSSIQSHIFRHANTIIVATLLLAVTQSFVPVFIVGATYRPIPLESALCGCLFATAIIPAISPRPQWTLYNEGESDEDLSFTHKASLEETCSLFSYYWSYEWITYLIIRGLRNELTIDDLPILPSYDAPIKWFRRMQRQRRPGSKTFFTLCRLLKKDIENMVFWAGLLAFGEFIAPSALMRLLGYLQDPTNAVIHPLVWITVLFFGPTLRTLCSQRYIFVATRLLVRVNMTLVQEIYHTAIRSHIYDSSVAERKVNHAGNAVDKELSKGRQADITTLMSSDVHAIYNGREIFFAPVVVPITVIIAVVYLYRLLGWPSLFGVATLFLLSPLPTLASRRVSRIQRSVMQATDARISKITEYLGSIRTLKYFGWEPAMEKEVDVLRQVEQSRVWKRNLTAAVISLAGDLLPMMSLLVSFSAVVVFTNNSLDAPKAFTALSIMEILRTQCVWVSNIVRNASTSLESLRRLDRFFDSAVEVKRHPQGPPAFHNATFRRTPVATFRLHDISVSFTESVLNVVTGPTGSGKTSLLLSLIGETMLESGVATCPRDVAYVPQTAWLQNDTVRENILFYSEFDRPRYDSVVSACGLLQDLEQLPDGDLTVVGERGTSLSGGQKQRVSLARAIYSQATTLLLDDVFSALDTHTTAWVYDQCFRKGLLAGRTVILVTHLPSALEDAQTIVYIENGTITSVQTNKDSTLASSGTSTISNEITVVESLGAVTPQNNGEVDPKQKPVAEDSVENVPEQKISSRLVAEQSSSGRIPRNIAFEYMFGFGGFGFVILVILSTLAVQVSYFSVTYWLSIWADAYDRSETIPNVSYYLSIYAGTILIYLTLQFGNVVIFQAGGWKAAQMMHRKLLHAILQAPVSWFDHNPVGRAMNRFGNDIRSMDTVLPEYLNKLIDNCLRFLFRIGSIATVMPIFIIPACIVCSIGIVIGEMYTRTQIQLKRLASINQSPIFIHFIDSIAGLSVIRARDGMDDKFFSLLSEKVARHSRALESQLNSNRWVAVRLDLCAATVTATVGLLAWKVGGDPGLVGFSLSHAVGLGQTILTLVRTMNDLEVELISFQRVKEYAEIQQEEQDQAIGATTRERQPPAHWPNAGQVEFSNVTAKYYDGPNILQNINFTIHPGERVGIVGRTGSGKSTLGLTLLRFTELVSGRVAIDGIDISKIPLNRLRTSIALIPQDPVLFSGDVQSNLDPFGELGETELQTALSTCCTSIAVAASSSSITNASNGDGNRNNNNQPQSLRLDTPVAANGENFSQGQRQVLGLARAVSRRAKVVLLDEATASVDKETDGHIQRLIRTEFPESTIIAIAHRLRTIVDYDRVIVMGGGQILEMGSPAELINLNGIFCDMLRKTGEYDELVQLIPNK